jgi:hypothetical protein
MTTGRDDDHAHGSNGASNGAGHHHDPEEEVGNDFAPPEPESAMGRKLLETPAPASIEDLANACVRFVERAVGVRLDYTLETLPLLDHYLDGARGVVGGPKSPATDPAAPGAAAETLEIVAQAAGAYFGEVVRRRYPSWWRLAPDATDHRIELHHLFLTIHPVAMMMEALTIDPDKPDQTLGTAGFDLDEEDREAAMARLAELPEAPIEEFVAPSTRLEVLDIVVDAVRADHLRRGQPSLELEPGDYDESEDDAADA